MRRDRLTRWVFGGVAMVGLLFAVAGCGSGTSSVSGQVTLNGKPLSGGAVTFYGANGQAGGSSIDAEGKYAMVKGPVGEVKVTVAAAQPRQSPRMSKERDAPKHPGDKGPAPSPTGKPVVIPDKYKDQGKTPLTYTLTAGSQVIDIELKP
jgi:hypothetical protein